MGILDNLLGKSIPPVDPGAIEEKSPWQPITEHPEENLIVLCECGSHLPVVYRTYCRGQFDHHTGTFFTSESGPHKILDVTRWMEVK